MFGNSLSGGAPGGLPTWIHVLIATTLVVGVLVSLLVVRRPVPADVVAPAGRRPRRRAVRLPASVRTVVSGVAVRLGLLVFGLVAGLVAAELLLQTVALVRRAVAPTPGARAVSGRPVLAVGDSNTYGLYLSSPADTYPSVLERLWNAGHPTETVEVVNAGFPGTNSSIVLDALPELLGRLHPSVVAILVGVNDFWTEPITGPSTLRRLRRWSRVYPLLVMLDHWIDPPLARYDAPEGVPKLDETTVPFAIQFRDKVIDDWIPALRNNLEEMVLLVREGGAVPVLLTYPGAAPWHDQEGVGERTRAASAVYSTANDAIRAAARAVGARLIDVDAVFHTRCATPECDELLYPDLHPRAAGYRVLAETLVAAWDGWGAAAAARPAAVR